MQFIEFIAPKSNPEQMVMELVNHDNLECAHEKKKMDMSHIKELISELLRSLQYLHSKHVTHCNLKPSNIMLIS